MFDKEFSELVGAGNPSGEVIKVDRYLVTVKGMSGCSVNATVLFQNGDWGIVRELHEGTAVVLNCENEQTPVGSVVVLKDEVFSIPTGEALVGRVVDPFGKPVDGKGDITLTNTRPIFDQAPGISERVALKDQLYSGVSIVDSLFPVVLGQRIAILGDTKSGKTSFLLQVGANQVKTDTVMVYVLIGKRRAEVDHLVATLEQTGAMAQSIVVVADVFRSLAQSYIAPYAGCAMAEYMWKEKQKDVVIVYDDLSAHAKVYREISLLAEANPGRESYPGDMFYSHSSLLERAGKLKTTGKTLTAFPVVVTPGDDITANLPTSIMSITDGQLIFDLTTFRQGNRPALNTGLSVSRVGGRAQTKRQQKLTSDIFKILTSYRQALEFSHFGSDLSADSKRLLEQGSQLLSAFRQLPNELHTIVEQELILRIVVESAGQYKVDIAQLKKEAEESAKAVNSDEDFEKSIKELLEVVKTGVVI